MVFTAVDDALPEGSEELELALMATDGDDNQVMVFPGELTLVVEDNDDMPVASITTSATTIREDGAVNLACPDNSNCAIVTVRLDRPARNMVTVNIMDPATATEGADYSYTVTSSGTTVDPTTGAITFAAGITEATARLTAIDDDVVEAVNEVIAFNLSTAGTGYIVNTASSGVSITILDAGASTTTASVTIDGMGMVGMVRNAPADTAGVVITPPGVRARAVPTASSSSLLRNHDGGSGCHVQGFPLTPGVARSCEYTEETGELELYNFLPADNNIAISFFDSENNEMGGTTATITVPAGAVSSTGGEPIWVAEDGTATYTLRLNSRPRGTVTVTLTVGGDNPNVVTVSPLTLTFTTTDWDVSQTITLAGVADIYDTADEEAGIRYAVEGYGTVSSFPYQDVYVADTTSASDIPPNVTVLADSVVLSEDGATVTLTATLRNPSATAVSLNLVHRSGRTATATASDYTIEPATLSLDSTTTRGTMVLTAVDDGEFEGHERLALGVRVVDENGADIRVRPEELLLVVEDNDDPAVTVEAPPYDVFIDEGSGVGDEGSTVLTFTLENPPTSGEVLVTPVPDPGSTAEAITDYILVPGFITLSAENPVATITVSSVADRIDESAAGDYNLS